MWVKILFSAAIVFYSVWNIHNEKPEDARRYPERDILDDIDLLTWQVWPDE